MEVEATNNFVFIIRDKPPKDGLFIPGQGKKKPHQGEIITVGELTKDNKIVNGIGKKAIFHEGIGFEIDLEGIVYLVLMDSEIIGIK